MERQDNEERRQSNNAQSEQPPGTISTNIEKRTGIKTQEGTGGRHAKDIQAATGENPQWPLQNNARSVDPILQSAKNSGNE